MLLYISIEPLNLGFTRKTGLEELSKHLGHFLLTSLAPGITKNDSSSTALEAVSQPINGCVAQHSGQFPVFEGKICSCGGSAHGIRVRLPYLVRGEAYQHRVSRVLSQSVLSTFP